MSAITSKPNRSITGAHLRVDLQSSSCISKTSMQPCISDHFQADAEEARPLDQDRTLVKQRRRRGKLQISCTAARLDEIAPRGMMCCFSSLEWVFVDRLSNQIMLCRAASPRERRWSDNLWLEHGEAVLAWLDCGWWPSRSTDT